ncbi:MAG: prenyltransferase/squalene oxidase repeat-containing protein [Acidimicrobiales bacterium]
MSHRSISCRTLAVLLALPVLAAVAWAAPARATERGSVRAAPVARTSLTSASAALDWVERELDANGSAMPSPFGQGSDWGLTLDSILALAAGSRGGSASATNATNNVLDHAPSYFTGADFGSPNDRYAGPLAKLLLGAVVQGADTSDVAGFDLEATLRALMVPSGAQAGRFSDVSDFGDFSNGFGEALGVLALARSDSGVPSAAVAFLLAQQCPTGGFRLFYAAQTSDPAGCTGDAEADTDATSFALMALLSEPATPATTASAGRAVTWLQGRQGADGGVSGTGPTGAENANSTGLAGAVLRASGETDAAAAAESWVESVQLTATDPAQSAAVDDVGAIARDVAARDAAISDGIASGSRDQFRRSTAQGVLALGLGGYDTVGGHTRATLVPNASTTTISPNAGDTILVDGTGFLTDEPVTAVLRSDPITIGTTAASAGAVRFSVPIPTDFSAGQHSVELTGSVSGSSARVLLQVQAPPPASTATTASASPTTTLGASSSNTNGRAGEGDARSASPLPRSGTDIREPILLAGACLLLGGAALAGANRRRRSTRRG